MIFIFDKTCQKTKTRFCHFLILEVGAKLVYRLRWGEFASPTDKKADNRKIKGRHPPPNHQKVTFGDGHFGKNGISIYGEV